MNTNTSRLPGIIHGSRASYIRYGCRCQDCRRANHDYEARTDFIHQGERAVSAIGFLVPCTRCGNWRHIHQRPSPYKVASIWARPCFECRDGKGRRSALVESTRYLAPRRDARLANRQMVTGGRL